MHRPSDYSQNVSLKLSEVLNDIGVNESMVKKRRRMILLHESVCNSSDRLLGKNISTYNFGSQSEGATTLGLDSDNDTLICHNDFNVIQDWNEWRLGKKNLLMIQDETTSPGYCLLQKLREDEPLPLPTASLQHLPDRHLTVRGDKVLLKNTVFNELVLPGNVINGPAQSTQGRSGTCDEDHVIAYSCRSWPIEARHWLERQIIGRWPTENMKRYCENTGCFVVPVGSKSGVHEELEWRISTSHAEKYLMFRLNITQLRCYILMKMILKTFINYQRDSVISSFMCKTVLFHCIQNTDSNKWRHCDLLANLICCLKVLQNFISEENCPHFIIPENNLMAGGIVSHHKYKIFEILQNIIQSEGRALLEIPIDNLGMRLRMKIDMVEIFPVYSSPAEISAVISTQLLVHITRTIFVSHNCLLRDMTHDGNEIVRERLSDFLVAVYRTQSESSSSSLDKSACELLSPVICSSLGSVIASHDIKTTHSISPQALAWLFAGLNSDVSSGRLKFASALYCAGDMERAESVLKSTEEKYELNTVEPVCGCYEYSRKTPRDGFMNKCRTGNEEAIKQITGLCIKFLHCEIDCTPKELQYEMFRSTRRDKLERHEFLDKWMELAVVDSLPYLYFLEYKTYAALQKAADQRSAIENLVTVTCKEPNLGHRETAFNLLGQCMEQENQHNAALRCYLRSLKIRRRNNAANIHICRLISNIVNK